MKVIATADLHFCETLRFDECLAVHRNILRIIKEEKPDLVVIAGDVYHRASTPRERAEFASWVTAVADECEVFIVRGNHDRLRDLEIISRLKAKHPIVVEERCGNHLTGSGILVTGLAWPDRRSLLAAAGPRAAGQDADQLARLAMRDIIIGLSKEDEEHLGLRILVGHLMVDGARTGHGQPLIGKPMNIPLSDLALSGAHVALLGHIHQAQEWDMGGGARAVYCGSPYRTEHGQLEEKSVVVVEFDEAGKATRRRVSTGARRMVDVEVTFDPQTGAFQVPDVDFSEATVRVRYDVSGASS